MASSLGWVADGLERAEAAGGVTLEKYRKVGFAAGMGVRRRPGDAQLSGFTFDDPEAWEWEEESTRVHRHRDR